MRTHDVEQEEQFVAHLFAANSEFEEGRWTGQSESEPSSDESFSASFVLKAPSMKLWAAGSVPSEDKEPPRTPPAEDSTVWFVVARPGNKDKSVSETERSADVGSSVGRALKNHSSAPKSSNLTHVEKAHNPTMTDVTRAELDAKFELLDTKLGARIQQAVDAMQARDEVHKHALEKAQAEFVARDALYAEMAKRQDLSTEKLKSEMAGRDAVYAEIAKRQELAAEKFREEMAGRDAVAAERARAHELTVQKALAEAAGREALMDQRLKSMDGELAKIGDSFKSVKANIWFGVATTASIVAAIVAVALAGFDSGRETSKAIAESTVKLEQLIKAQEAKAAAPAAPAISSAATPAPTATPEAPAAK